MSRYYVVLIKNNFISPNRFVSDGIFELKDGLPDRSKEIKENDLEELCEIKIFDNKENKWTKKRFFEPKAYNNEIKKLFREQQIELEKLRKDIKKIYSEMEYYKSLSELL
jgi:hypothetical protein